MKPHLLFTAAILAITGLLFAVETCHAQTTTLYGASEDVDITFTYSNTYEAFITATNKSTQVLEFDQNVNEPPYQSGVYMPVKIVLSIGETESGNAHYYGPALGVVFKVNGEIVPLSVTKSVPEASTALLSIGSLVMFRRRRSA